MSDVHYYVYSATITATATSNLRYRFMFDDNAKLIYYRHNRISGGGIPAAALSVRRTSTKGTDRDLKTPRTVPR